MCKVIAPLAERKLRNNFKEDNFVAGKCVFQVLKLHFAKSLLNTTRFCQEDQRKSGFPSMKMTLCPKKLYLIHTGLKEVSEMLDRMMSVLVQGSEQLLQAFLHPETKSKLMLYMKNF